MHRTKSKALKFLRAAILSGAAVLTSSALESGAARAQEAGAGLIQRQAAFEEVLGRIEAALTWAPVAPNVKAFDAWLKQDPARREAYEFGISRNSGFRILHVSSWNQGFRYMTEPYMTGDLTSGSPGGGGFYLGGSLWLVGTRDPADAACLENKPDPERKNPDGTGRVVPGGVKHYYYFYGPDGVKPASGNGCTVEGPVYARARLFKP
ncbi:hypothetical protein [Neomegalonema perideroedes]|uniref:hypothetical protein n=1 Tax=Neomegalonema perideroedes TaxID=217219 RepID=UPI00037E06E3|nr:hypothetical protein [Neomegalonema perideroedes]